MINSQGRETIPRKYDQIWPFAGELAPVKIGKKIGVINSKGDLLLPAQYDWAVISDKNYIVVRSGGKQGVVSSANKVLIPIKHDLVKYLRSNAFLVSDSGRYGIINAQNRVIIPVKNNDIKPFGEGYTVDGWGDGVALFSAEGKQLTKITRRSRQNSNYPIWRSGDSSFVYNARYKKFVGYEHLWEYYEPNNRYQRDRRHKPRLYYFRKKKWGVLDTTGVELTPPVFDSVDLQRVENLNNKWMPVSAKQNGKWGLIDARGKAVLPFSYDNIQPIYNGVLVQQGKKVGLLDNQLKAVLPVEFDSIASTIDHYNASTWQNFRYYLFARSNKKWAYFSPTGKQLTPFKYDTYPNIQRNVGIVKINNLYGIINTKGKPLTDCIYDRIEYSDGYNIAYDKRLVITKGKLLGLLDTAGHVLVPPVYDLLNQMQYPFWGKYQATYKNKMGMLDGDGNKVIPFDYDEIRYYNSGSSDPCITVKKGWYYGLIDRSGQLCTELIYRQIYMSDDHKYKVILNGKTGLLDISGNPIIAPLYDDILMADANGYIYKQDYKQGLMTLQGKPITEPLYDEILRYSPDFIVVKKDFKYGVIDADGKEKYPCIYLKIKYNQGGQPEFIKW